MVSYATTINILNGEYVENFSYRTNTKAKEVEPLFSKGDYALYLSSLSSLRESIDNFFDNVMVMADDEAVKQNRLALLNQLRNLFLKVADISLL